MSSLNIAQVKRIHGLIERENFNVGEGKSKTPQLPIEKQRATPEALRCFGLIG